MKITSVVRWIARKPSCSLHNTLRVAHQSSKPSAIILIRSFRTVSMSAYTTKKWVVKTPYKGQPKREDLEIVEEQLPPVKDGGTYSYCLRQNTRLHIFLMSKMSV